MVFVRGFITKQMKNFETKNAETICLELTTIKKRWCILFAYRPPNTVKELFDQISVSLNKILGKYIILAGDLNIDELRPCSDSSKNNLSDKKDIFSLTSLIKEPNCFKSTNSTLLDLILTKRPRSFMQSQSFKTGLSDCHKLVCSILRAYLKKVPHKTIKYRDQKHFDQKKFFRDLDSKLLRGAVRKTFGNFC